MERYELYKKEIKNQMLERLDMSKDLTDSEILNMIDETILSEPDSNYLSIREKSQMRRDIFNSLRRLDILQELIDDKEVTEIMVNGANQIFVEKKGKIMAWSKQFESTEKLEDVVQQIVAKSNRIVNEATPIVDARLEDGSRVNVVLPPIALGGPILTIRKFPSSPITMEELIQMEAISEEAAVFLRKLVMAKYNIFISGGTGSGKTTFLNALSNYIPEDERIITIEDSAELQIQNVHNLVRMEVRNANVEGKNEISMRDLIKSSLRMRPDRIIIGEVRDAEATINMLVSFNTGHDGSLSTAHANSIPDTLSRLENLVLQGGEIPLLAVRQQIASALDIIIFVGRLRDKTRKVLEIAEVLDCSDGEIEINSLYNFQELGEKDGYVIGKMVRSNSSLIHLGKLKKAGLAYD